MKRRIPKLNAGLFDELIVDSFAGGGGASLGIERALGRCVDVAVNHDREAVAMHAANHPHTRHYCEDVWQVDPVEATGGRPVGLAWFSPDCKHFSKAKGGKPVEKKIRGLAWVVIRWAKAVRPRVIMLENVAEFQTWGPLVPLVRDGARVVEADGRPRMVPCPARKGKTFRLFVGKLRRLGYQVEWKTLDAADFGAPTHRKRLFLCARRDGLPIAWPQPTHGPGRPRKHRTAAQCIDWSLPCPSIFLTREEGRAVGVNRPLAEKTMRRIAMGLKRFVLENPKPFIVRCDHGGDHFRGQSVEKPLATVTGSHGFGVVAPFLAQHNGEAPHQETRGRRVDRPIGVVTPRESGGFPLVAASLMQYHGEKGDEVRSRPPDVPINTLDASNRFALVAAFLAKHYGGVVGHSPERPIGTVTAVDHHSVAAATLIKSNHGDKQWNAVDEPMRTIMAGGMHHALVCAFLTKYFGTGVGQAAAEPLHTITAVERFGLVKVGGVDHVVADVGMRMLTPRELYRCQGFDDGYVIAPIVNGRRLPKSAQVRMVGNSVCPDVAAAMVRANLVEVEIEAAS